MKAFTYNQHFVAMMNVINAARLNPPTDGQNHHILPRSWFKMNDLPVDNSDDNLVKLTYEDHLLVHQLAVLASNSPEFKNKMLNAVSVLSKGFRPKGIYIDEETRQKISSTLKTKYENTDLAKRISEATKEGMKSVDRNKLNYWKGKKLSDEHRKKIGLASTGRPSPSKGKHWKLVDGRRVYYV